MAKDIFKFKLVKPRGEDFYFGKGGEEFLRKLFRALVAEEIASERAHVVGAMKLAESQLRRLAGPELKKGEAEKTAKEVCEFLAQAEKRKPSLTDVSAVDPHSMLSKINSPGTRWPVYDATFTQVSGAGLGFVSAPDNPEEGFLGGDCRLIYAGDGYVFVGAGFWLHTGEREGTLEISAYFNTYGRCALSAIGGYAYTRVSLNAGIFGGDTTRAAPTENLLAVNRTDIYNNTVIGAGLTSREFRSQTNWVNAEARVHPNKWYCILGWTKIWTTVAGNASGGSYIDTYLGKIQWWLPWLMRWFPQG